MRSKRFSKRIKEAPAKVETVELSEIDVKIGVVVASVNGKAVVKIRNYQIFPQWRQVFYVSDNSMNLVAILEATDVKNKSCALFEIKSGSVLQGDNVYLKQIPPTK